MEFTVGAGFTADTGLAVDRFMADAAVTGSAGIADETATCLFADASGNAVCNVARLFAPSVFLSLTDEIVVRS